MHDPMTFEGRLADAYARWAGEMPTDVDALGLVRATRARGSIGRRAWFMRPMRMVLLLVLLAALALAAALLVASQRPDEPRPSTSYVAVVSRSTDLDSVPYDEPRQMSIVAIRSDGQERLITTLRIAPRDPLSRSMAGWPMARASSRESIIRGGAWSTSMVDRMARSSPDSIHPSARTGDRPG